MKQKTSFVLSNFKWNLDLTKKSSTKCQTFFVPTTGFEPARLLAPPPQDGMSTNFTTWASIRDKDNFFT